MKKIINAGFVALFLCTFIFVFSNFLLIYIFPYIILFKRVFGPLAQLVRAHP